MIVLDVEATGLNVEKHSLLSIGALDFNNPEDRFYEECRAWDGAEVMPEALAVNGYTEEEVRDPAKKTEADIVQNFWDWLKDKEDITVAGQIAHFDRAFINAASKRAGVKEALPHRVCELHTVAMIHMIKRGLTPPIKDRRSNLGSDTITQYVGIPPEPKPHVAINGAIWHYEALYRLIYDKPGLEEFQAYPIPWLNHNV